MRNTPEELAELEPEVTGELRAVFARYGIVVLGYSGSDEAIARGLRARRSRYGLWWVARGEPAQPAAELIEAAGGRVIARDTAAEFVADLSRRLTVFEQHPSGQTPGTVHEETLALTRSRDSIGLDEHLRRERHWYSGALDAVNRDASQRHPANKDDVRELWSSLRPALERRLASLLPLALHDVDIFAIELGHLARQLERQPIASGYTAWAKLPQ